MIPKYFLFTTDLILHNPSISYKSKKDHPQATNLTPPGVLNPKSLSGNYDIYRKIIQVS